MPFLYIVITGAFILSPFILNISHEIDNPILAYLTVQYQFFRENEVFFLFGVCAIVLYYFMSKKHQVRKPFLKRLLRAATHTGKIFGLSLILAWIGLFLVAWLQLASTSILVSINPRLLGVTTDTEKIATILSSNKTAPKTLVGSEIAKQQVRNIATINTGSNTFYSSHFLATIPEFLILPTKQLNTNMFMVGNTLVFTQLSTKELNVVTPILGHLYIREYFQTQHIKSYPAFAIMDMDLYNAYRTQDSLKRIETIGMEVGDLNQKESSMSAILNADKNALETKQQQLETAKKNKSIISKKCTSKGVYHSGTVYDQYPITECENLTREIDAQILILQNEVDSAQKKVQTEQSQIATHESNKSFLSAKNNALVTRINTLGNERGVFEPPDSIKMVLESSDPHTIADYFEVLVHEYLHYASYTQKKTLPTFFEEGLTEYFTRQIILYNLDFPAQFGYPIPVAIIQEMTKNIAEGELATIYINKDQAQLEMTLDRVYGDGFYARNEVLFQYLLYSTNQKQTLEIANKIMHQIGGRELTEKDAVSKPNIIK